MPGVRRKNPIINKRRVDDEGEEDGGHDDLLGDEDSLSEASLSDDDLAEGSERSRMDSASPELLRAVEINGTSASSVIAGDGGAKAARSAQKPKAQPLVVNGNSDTDLMINGLHISEQITATDEVHFDDVQGDKNGSAVMLSPPVVGSTAQMDQPQESAMDRRRREHDEYKKKRDADPAFVPNRGAFFMHDHRHAGPAANGFRPFGRGRGRGGRGAIGGPFAPMQ